MKYNYFAENQEDFTILGGNVPSLVNFEFCAEIDDTYEINVQMTAQGIEGAVINILKDENVVAVAKADDLEEPSSLSALYKGSF